MAKRKKPTKNKECKVCKALLKLVNALEEVVEYYADDHERSTYDFEDLPEELQEAEKAVNKAYGEYGKFVKD